MDFQELFTQYGPFAGGHLRRIWVDLAAELDLKGSSSYMVRPLLYH